MLIPIYELTESKIQAEVRAALNRGVDRLALARFAASIDWSRQGSVSPSSNVVRMLGSLEAWTTEADEGDLSTREYIARLRSLLPEDEAIDRALKAKPAPAS